MKQQTLGNGFEKYSRTTKRVRFLEQMDRVMPWASLCEVIEPYYFKSSGSGGRPPMALERMLRIYFLQQWFNLSDPAAEEALYDSASMRGFAGIDLGIEAPPDETTICKFRHLLERNTLGKPLFGQVQRYLQEQGFKVSTGTIVDGVWPRQGVTQCHALLSQTRSSTRPARRRISNSSVTRRCTRPARATSGTSA